MPRFLEGRRDRHIERACARSYADAIAPAAEHVRDQVRATAVHGDYRSGVDVDELQHESHGDGVIAGEELRESDVGIDASAPGETQGHRWILLGGRLGRGGSLPSSS